MSISTSIPRWFNMPPKEVTITWKFWNITTTALNTVIIIYKIYNISSDIKKKLLIIIKIITIIMQFLLHIHKKNVFLLPITTEVPFCAEILYQSLQDSIFQQSIWAKVIQVVWGPHYVWHRTKSQKNCLFMLSPHHAMVASFSSLSILCKPAPTDAPAFTIWYCFIRSISYLSLISYLCGEQLTC